MAHLYEVAAKLGVHRPRIKLGSFHQYLPKKIHVPKRYADITDLSHYPKISIATPSLNSAAFIDRTINSVMSQGYQNIEYVVQDGGSSDSTVDMLKKWSGFNVQWTSGHDKGQANAINLAFRKTTGEIMGYLNADDFLLSGSLHYIAKYFADHPKVDIIYGHRIVVDEFDREVGRWIIPPHSNDILSWADYIPQETLFWRRRIWKCVGENLDETFEFALDWDLILRFRETGAKFVRLPRFLGAFRVHSQQKTSRELTTTGEKEMNRLRMRCLGYLPTPKAIRKKLRYYYSLHLILTRMYYLNLINY